MALTMEEMAKKIEALEKEVRIARDIQEIQKVQHRYVSGFFLAKWDMVESCFAENATFGDPDGKPPKGMPEELLKKMPPPARGPAAITKALREQAEGGHVDRTGGFVVHPIINVEGDRATGNWLLYMLLSYHLTGQLLFFLQRTYDPVYIREKGTWKILSMNMSMSRLGPDMAKGPDGMPLMPPYPGT